MNPLASLLRAELLRYDPLILRDIEPPYGPDSLVFGPEPPERPDPDYPAIGRECRKHDVRWRDGEKCFCCVAGIPALTEHK